jgi:hypothetical protein
MPGIAQPRLAQPGLSEEPLPFAVISVRLDRFAEGAMPAWQGMRMSLG